MLRSRAMAIALCTVLAAGVIVLLWGFRRYDPPRPPCQCAEPSPSPVEVGDRTENWCAECGRTVSPAPAARR